MKGQVEATSRILQAILSTQLYVQRCFLNLENREVETALPDPDVENSWEQWKCMKSYRIWEANRKVFLFPENWIEPELRDTKSPFFEELESDILSREATNDNVEAALQRYIQKLEEVSRLHVCSIFHEKDGPTDLLHVSGGLFSGINQGDAAAHHFLYSSFEERIMRAPEH